MKAGLCVAKERDFVAELLKDEGGVVKGQLVCLGGSLC